MARACLSTSTQLSNGVKIGCFRKNNRSCYACRQVVLSEMDILGGFDPGQIALIESVLKEVSYSPGETIIREGEIADSLYLLAAGRVSIRSEEHTSELQSRPH